MSLGGRGCRWRTVLSRAVDDLEDDSPSWMRRQRHRLGAVPCVIVFGGNEKEPLTLRLDLDADEVAKSLRGHSLQRIELQGRVLWVNPQNVLYVEDAPTA